MAKRTYHLRRRAERQEETRQRIIDATIALLERVGMTGTTISAVAEEAGVERLTVYRHFPDEEALLTATTADYLEHNPLPDPLPWLLNESPERRLIVGLAEVYRYHRQTQALIGSLIRGMPYKPVYCDVLEAYAAHWAEVQRALMVGWSARDKMLLAAAIGHALSFKTWHSLTYDVGLVDTKILQLMAVMVYGSTK